MKCLRCQYENPSGSNFCLGCGTRLGATCGACGNDLPAGSRFCNKCGIPVSGESAGQTRFASPESYTPVHLANKILTSKTALEGERKQVTVLFADLKGSMELLADRDPEEARKLLDPVLEHMMEAVHRYEGTVNQVMGDGIMALFGAPLAHEDHAVRACYAALRMQEAVKRYSDGMRRTEGISVRIRVGLNSGEVVVRAIGSDLHMDYTAVGQTTHLAARMEQLADPGAVLVAPATLALAEDFIQVRSLGPTPVKGVSEPVEVYELVGANPARSRFRAHAARGLTKFVGRTSEIAHLGEALDLARNARGQVVAVVGEPGVGKSRLLWEFAHSHRVDPCLVIETASVSYGKATTYLPVIELLRGYFQIAPHDDMRKIREKVTGKLLSLDRELEPTLPALLALLDVPVEEQEWTRVEPPQRRQRTLDAVKRLLLRESQVQPLVVIVEDLHWIDGETQAVLDGLVESLPTARMLLLVNYRPEYQHGWGSKTYYRQVRLDALPSATAEELLQALLGRDPSLEPLKRLLIERTEGNPFFLEESVRTLVETAVLEGAAGAYQLTRAPAGLQIPATAQAIVAARIDRLDPEDKRLLQAASVIGKDVPLALLEAIADMPESGLRRSLARLQATEFLYETRLFPEVEYTFKHALTHEVTYGGLLQERRRTLHAQVVDAIETLHRDRLDEQTERLAHHALRGELREKAVHYLRQAGVRAVARSAYANAISHLATALELLNTLPDTAERARQELEVQIALGPALIAIKGGGAPEVEQVYTRARVLCTQVGDTPQLFPVLWGLREFYNTRGELQTARELGEQGLALAQRQDDATLVLEAHAALGTTLFYLGEFASARSHTEQGLALYDTEQHRHLAYRGAGFDVGVLCFGGLIHPLWYLGYPDQALQRSREAATLARGLAHPLSLAAALSWVARFRQLRREPQVVHELAESVIALATAQGFPQWRAQGIVLQGWALAEQGQAAEGVAQIRKGLAAWRATGAEIGRQWRLLLLADAQGKMGQTTEGLATLAEALAVVERTGDRRDEAELHRLKGEFLLQQPVPSELQAETCFRQALEIASRQTAKSLELRARMSLSRLFRRQGKHEDARRMLAEIYDWFTEGFETADLKDARALLDALTTS